jgi:hypothetical protein
MKKFIFALIAMVMMTVSATAMSYEQARQQALFLTDKMAYELNLTDEQYEAAYEINLDYLMGVRTVDDLYGPYWERRNLDLSYILLSWQYRAFCDAAYFYRPLYWNAGYWHFGVYARYPYRDYFFFGRPTVYIEYRGGHSWHMNGGRSWYRDRRICPPHHNNYFGMRDGFRRGDFGNGYSGNPSSRTQFGTAQRPPMMNNGTMSFGNANRNNSSFGNANRNNNSFGNANRNNSSFGNANRNNSFGNGNVNGNNAQFGSGRRSSASSRGNSAFGSNGRESSTRSTVGNSQSTFGSRRSGSTTSTPRNTFSPSRNEGSSSSSGSSFGLGRRSSSSFGGGRGSSSFGSSNRPSAPSVAPSRGNSSFGGGRSGGSSFGGGRSGGSSFGGGRSSGGSFGGGSNHGGGGHGSFGSRR